MRGDLMGSSAECAVVAMESVTVVAPLPAGIVAKGEKLAVAPVGNPDAVSVTEFAVAPFEGVTTRLYLAELPATTELLGVGTLSMKSPTTSVSAAVVPPPGIGLFTVMLSVPLRVKSLAGRAASSEVELTKVVARELPLTRTMELVLKFAPVTARVAAALPTGTLDGETLLTPGTGLLTVKVITTDALPPGLATVTKGVPATAMALAGIAACNSVELT
jgi:hypothetical protein